jgi:hypothetical protein
MSPTTGQQALRLLRWLMLASAALCVFPSALFAVDARVVYVDPKLRFLVIDKGVHRDLAAGSHVCLLNETGFIVTCSGIVLANKTKAGLRFPLAEMKKMKVGSKVRLKTVYLKADGPRGLKSAPKFYQAKVNPSTVPKAVFRDAVRAEKLVGTRKLEPRPPVEEKPAEATPEAAAAAAATGAASAGKDVAGVGSGTGQTGEAGAAGDGQTPSGEPKPEELESGEEVTHEVGKPYPAEVAVDPPPPAEPATDAQAGAETEQDSEEDTEEDEVEEKTADQQEKKGEPGDAAAPQTWTLVDDILGLFTRQVPVKFFRYEAQALRPIFSHIRYNYIDFDTITPETSSRSSLWKDSASQAPPSSGLGIQLKVFGRGSWVYNVGWRYWNFDNYRSVQRLDTSFVDLVADTRMTVDSSAAWGELGIRKLLVGRLGYYYGGGLDIDMSEVKFQSIRRIDDGVERTSSLAAQEGIIGFARSNLTIVSLRTSGSLEFSVFNVGTTLTGVALIPVYAARQSYEGSVSVPANVSIDSSGDDDLKRAIGHDKGQFGLELSLGFFFNM